MNNDRLVLVDIKDQVATLTMNRPARLNAIDPSMAHAFLEAVHEIAGNSSARVVMLRGNGASFCAGGDVLAMQAHLHDLPAFIDRTIEPFHAAILALRKLPMAVVACVQGAAAGGGFSLAMACDLVLTTQSARFVVAYSKLGAPADGGLSFFLTQRLGRVKSFEALTVHGTFDAARALSLGLVNEIVDDDSLDDAINRWAKELLALTPNSLREIKGLVSAQSEESLAAHLMREKQAFVRCAAEPDFRERVLSVLQRQAKAL